MFVACTSVSFIYYSSDSRDYSWLRLDLDVGKWSRFKFWIKMLFGLSGTHLTQQNQDV